MNKLGSKHMVGGALILGGLVLVYVGYKKMK